ncbi:MAG TPA: hypothetical protein VJ962_00645 [Clostridia bacterium]|nr:hypothetical protein [Clostridia bacterium]
MDLNILKIMRTESCCEYEVFLDDSEESSDFLDVDEGKNHMSFFKVNTLGNVKEGDELYIIDASGEDDIFPRPKLTKEFDEAKKIMETITHQYVESNGSASKHIVNNICVDSNTYSNNSIKSFEKNIDIANHHLILSIHKVRVNK